MTADISQIKFLYQKLRFEEAINHGQRILSEGTDFSKGHLEYIHQYMAFSYYNIGNSDSARVQFLSLLSLNQDFELDPLETSPKIIDFFNQIKTDFQEINDNPTILSYPKYIFVEDKRVPASWRSAILPGWGQHYKQQYTRAYIFGGSFIASAAILGVSIVNENKYQNSYLNSTNPQDISDFYDKYNNWHKVRIFSTYTTIGIWVLSIADALWSGYPKVDINSSKNFNSVVISVTHNF